MTDKEQLQKFDADFARLQHNRGQVPIERLRTKYAKAYNALIADVQAGADWFSDTYIKMMVDDWPRHPRDTAGNEWLDRRLAAILDEERRPGGRFEQYRAALLDRLDRPAFEQLVWEIYNRLELEAYLPYFYRHCKWIGGPGERWIYNDILKMYWCDPDRRPSGWKKKGYFKDGCWVSRDWSKQDCSYPPPENMKEDIQDGQDEID